jgi:peroxiredoxin
MMRHQPIRARSIAIAAAALVFVSACGAPSTGSDPATPASVAGNTTPGDARPGDTSSAGEATRNVADFTLETVDGETVHLSDYVGKNVILLDFWATWCEPCLAAMPHLQKMYETHKGDGFVVLSISMDGPETVAEVRSYVQRQNLSFPVLLDEESRAVSLYNPKRSAPYSVLIARDGTILHKRDGYQPGDEIEIEKEVVAAMGR